MIAQADHSFRALTLIAFLLSPSLCMHSQITWERVDQTPDGPLNRVDVSAITFAPDGTPIILSGNGIYRIEEAFVGDAPALVGHHVEENVRAGFIDSWSSLHAYCDQAFYRSDDNGTTWHEVYRPTETVAQKLCFETAGHLITLNAKRDQIRVQPSNGTPAYFAQLPSGTVDLRSTPSGRLLAVTTASSHMFYSDDLGRNWMMMLIEGLEEATGNFAQLRVLSDSVFAIIYGSDIYLSRNGGGSWYRCHIGLNLYLDFFRLQITDDGRLFLVYGNVEVTETGEKVAVSADTGRTWQTECASVIWANQFTVSPSGRMFTESDGQIYWRDNCADQWHPISYGFRNVRVEEIVAYDTTFYATMWRTQGFETRWKRMLEHFRSDDNGSTWVPIATALQGHVEVDRDGNIYIQQDFEHDTVIDGVGSTTLYYELVRSTDRGETWKPVFAESSEHLNGAGGFEFGSGPDGLVVFGHRLFRLGSGHWYRTWISTDGGETFNETDAWGDTAHTRPVAYDILPDGRVYGLAALYEGGVVIARGAIRFDPGTGAREELEAPATSSLSVGREGRVYTWDLTAAYRSDDYGTTWTELSTPPTFASNWEIRETADGSLWLHRGHELFRSRDFGETWVEIVRTTPWDIPDIGGDEEHTPAIVLEDGTIFDSVYVERKDPCFGTPVMWQYYTFARSSDGGQEWSYPVDGGLDRRHISAIAYASDGTLIVGTEHDGIYRAGNGESGVHEDQRTVSEDLDLTIVPDSGPKPEGHHQ